MSTIFHVMKEEYERLNDVQSSYSKAIAELPKGSLCVKHIRNSEYLYLERREGKRVVFEYVGPAASENAKQVIEKVNKRKKYEQLLKQAKASLKDVKKVLRGKI